MPYSSESNREILELNNFRPKEMSEGLEAVGLQQTSAKDLLTLGAPAAVAGFVDTVGQSLGVLDDGEVTEFLKKNAESLGNFYEKHTSGAQMAGDIAGMFVPLVGATKLIRAGSILHKAGKTAGVSEDYLSKIFSSGKTSQELAERAIERAKVLAESRTIDFTNLSNVYDRDYQKLVRNAKITSATDVVKESIAAETALYATMNESETLFPDSMSAIEYMALFGGVSSVIAGASVLGTRHAIKTGLINQVGVVAAAARNPEGWNVTEIFDRVGYRGDGIAVNADMRRTMQEESKAPISDAHFTNLKKGINEHEAEIKNQVAHLFNDQPLPELKWGSQKIGPGQLETAYRAFTENPSLSVGVQAMRHLPENYVEEVVQGSNKTLADLQETARTLRKANAPAAEIDAIQTKIDYLQNSFFGVLERDGALVSLQDRKKLFSDNPAKISHTTKTNADAGKYETMAGEVRLSMTDDFFTNIEKPETLNLFHRSAVFEMAKRNIARMEKHGIEDLSLATTDHWLRYDAVLQMAQRQENPLDILNRVQLPKTAASLADLEFMSLDKKFVEYQKIRNQMEANQGYMAVFRNPELNYSHIDLARMLNLPVDSSGGLSPVIRLFEELRTHGVAEEFPNRVFNLSELVSSTGAFKELIVKSTAPTELGKKIRDDFTLTGNMLEDFGESKPVLMHYMTQPDGLISRETINADIAARRTMQMDKLKAVSPDDAAIVSAVAQTIFKNPEALAQAKKVDQLIEGSQFGTGTTTTTAFSVRENPVVEAIDSLADISDKAGNRIIEQIWKTHEVKLQQIQSRDRIGDLENWNLVRHARGQGWDLLPEIGEQDGKFFLRLDPESEFNQKRFAELFPEQSKAGLPEFMPSIDGTPQAMSELTRDVMQSFHDISLDTLNNLNTLRTLQGLAPIPAKNFHLPPKNLAYENLLFLVDEVGKVKAVEGGSTPAEALKKAQKAAETAGGKLAIVNPNDVGRRFDLLSETFIRPRDYSNPRLQTGKAKGTSFGGVIESGHLPIQSSIQAMQRLQESIIKETRALMFEPELKFAKYQQRTGVSQAVSDKRRSIFDVYENRIFGVQALDKSTTLGNAYMAAEHAYDRLLQSVFDKIADIKYDEKITARDHKAFNELNKTLGDDYTPFTSVLDYAEKTQKLNLPQTLRKHGTALNKVTGLVALRLLDAGMAAINLLSLGATIPAVAKSMQRLPNETTDVWRNRIKAYGMELSDDVAVLNPTRAIASATHFMFTKDGQDVWKRAAEKGLLQQEIAERMSLFNAPIQGSKTAFVDNMLNKMSWLTDKSETMSRGISFMVGYDMGRNALRMNDDAAMQFAHHFANQSIGDYRPNNRPQMFQGAAGLPLGLFTTFMWNFYQRMFSMVEKKQFGALMNQIGMQGALFGAGSLPGFKQFNEIFTSNYDGTENLVTRLENNYGTDFTDMFLHGSVSNLPKLLGADTGIALYTRAELQIPLVTSDSFVDMVPGLRMANQVREGFGKIVDHMKETGEISPGKIAELTSTYSPHRATRSALELIQGYSVDRSAQMINSDISSGVEVAARVLGFKTTREQVKQEQLWNMKQTQLKHRELRSRLNEDFRYLARQGEISGDDIERILGNYIKSGGTLGGFRQWFSANLLTATYDKSAVTLLKNLSAGEGEGNARLMMLELGAY